MKERSEKIMEPILMKDNCLRIPNITWNLYISLSVLEITRLKIEHFEKLTFLEHQIGETGFEDCGASWGSWSSVILAIGLTCVIG